jgi:hypothetical protein
VLPEPGLTLQQVVAEEKTTVFTVFSRPPLVITGSCCWSWCSATVARFMATET